MKIEVRRHAAIPAAAALALALVWGCGHEGVAVPAYPEERLESESMADFETVFLFGEAASPPVLLLHELPGLSPQSLWFADRLSESYRVYVPLLFGDHNSSREAISGLAQYAFTGRWRFDGAAGVSRPLLRELGVLVERVSESHPGQALGVIGMCLTGSLPIALARHEAVSAIVVAQPSLPLLNWGRAARRGELGVSTGELERATQRVLAGELRVYGTRIEGDEISKWEKWPTMERLWGDRFIDREICAAERDEHEIEAGAHSTLTGEWRPGLAADHPVEVRQREVAEFLADPGFGARVEPSRCRRRPGG